jgi:hypothetical protein
MGAALADVLRAARSLRNCHVAGIARWWLKGATGEATICTYASVVLEPTAKGGTPNSWKKRPIKSSWAALRMGTRRPSGFSRDATRLEPLGLRNASSKITPWPKRSSRRHYCGSGSMRPAGVRMRRSRLGSFALSSICVSTRNDALPSCPWSQPANLQIPVPMQLGRSRRENWTRTLPPPSTRSLIDNGQQYCSPTTKALVTQRPRRSSTLRSRRSKHCWHERSGRCVWPWPVMQAENGPS